MVPANPLGSIFIELHSVDSTNNYAMALVHEGLAQHGTAVFAHEQRKGKGQRGKQWVSTRNENITLSVIITPFALNISKLFLLSMAVATAVHRFFSRYAGDETRIKWPNDLYWRDRKAGGILIENVLQGSEWKYAIIGIGLNLNQTDFPPMDRKAVSLKQITGSTHDPLSLAKELLGDLESALDQLRSQPDTIADHYRSHLFRRYQPVRLKQGERVFDASIKDVTDDGQLVVQHALEERFAVGEIEWIL
ncbi:biotin--[acetyl-CoA-carboxylase] ligase [Paraflavisolibacter sp. H34]|uniref:biotin--[acetyl-CoA-carboxylase] ligase n=1 Tax=Huijunlia imazamoxiresistens TaxID=3127457 RepID=UPI003017378B